MKEGSTYMILLCDMQSSWPKVVARGNLLHSHGFYGSHNTTAYNGGILSSHKNTTIALYFLLFNARKKQLILSFISVSALIKKDLKFIKCYIQSFKSIYMAEQSPIATVYSVHHRNRMSGLAESSSLTIEQHEPLIHRWRRYVSENNPMTNISSQIEYASFEIETPE
jgi:hypothetical protein